MAGFPRREPRTRLAARVATALLTLPRHLGQHSGGMVLAAGRLDEVVPLEPAAMPGRVVVQWDKDDCADMGIVKVDLLGLGMMAVLDDAVPLIARHEKVDIDYARLPPDDPEGLRDAARRRHRRRVPGRVAGPDGDAAAHEARALLRPGRRGGDHPPRPDRRQAGEPVPRTAQRARARDLPAPVAGADPEAHAGGAAVSGAADPDRDDGGRLLGRPGRGAAAGDGVQALGGAHGEDRGRAARRDGPKRDLRTRRRRRSSPGSNRSRSTASPSHTRRRSRSSPTRRPT